MPTQALNKNKTLIWLFAAVMALRAFFLLNTGLVDDDAYHWSWTQSLDWSYFDHPGMIAWLEALSTGIFGQEIFALSFNN